jgi:hypothetical protein
MKKGLTAILGFLMGVAAVAYAQTIVQRPQYPQTGLSYVGYGDAVPTTELFGGELFIDVNGQTDGGPLLQVYDDTTLVWDRVLSSSGLTQNFLPKYDANELINSAIRSVGIPAAGASGVVADISPVLNAMDGVGPDSVFVFYIDPTNANHLVGGNTLIGMHIDGIVADADATEIAAYIGSGWDRDIEFEDTAAVIFLQDQYDLVIGNTAPSTQLWVRDNDVGQEYLEIELTSPLLDVADTGTGLMVDITNNAGSTGGTLIGIDIDNITGNAAVAEVAAQIGSGFDVDMQFIDASVAVAFPTGGDLTLYEAAGATYLDLEGAAARTYGIRGRGTVIDIDHGITTLVELAPTLTANDNANDQRNVLLIDVDVPNGSAGLVNGINIDGVTDDIQSIDSAIFIEGGWDSAITITERGSIATANPLTGTVWIFLDDSADYSGAGGNDCWLIARDANGTNNMLFQITLNGACP